MKYVLCLIFLIFSLSAAVKSVDSGVAIEIKKMYFYSTGETNPDFKGMVQIDFGTIPWTTNTNCNTRYVMVRGEDSHIISALLSAQARNEPVRIYTEDSINNSGGCVLRAIGL